MAWEERASIYMVEGSAVPTGKSAHSKLIVGTDSLASCPSCRSHALNSGPTDPGGGKIVR